MLSKRYIFKDHPPSILDIVICVQPLTNFCDWKVNTDAYNTFLTKIALFCCPLREFASGMNLRRHDRGCTHITISRIEGGWSLKIYLYDNMGGSRSELGQFGEWVLHFCIIYFTGSGLIFFISRGGGQEKYISYTSGGWVVHRRPKYDIDICVQPLYWNYPKSWCIERPIKRMPILSGVKSYKISLMV